MQMIITENINACILRLPSFLFIVYLFRMLFLFLLNNL